MGLFDSFRRKVDPPSPDLLDVVRRLGRAEAEVERIALQWESYKDEMKRLVQRLEKREQRAEERAARERDREPDFEPPAHDRATARVLARRNAMITRGTNGVSE